MRVGANELLRVSEHLPPLGLPVVGVAETEEGQRRLPR